MNAGLVKQAALAARQRQEEVEIAGCARQIVNDVIWRNARHVEFAALQAARGDRVRCARIMDRIPQGIVALTRLA